MTKTESAIIKTLSYGDIFDYPLQLNEIHRFLISDLAVSRLEVESTLSKMTAETRLCERAGNYYCLSGRRSVVDQRVSCVGPSARKMEIAKTIVEKLKFIPWILFVGVTGRLAVENSDEDDDIDLMIITGRKRLWLSRVFVVLFLLAIARYRRPKKIKDMICPNLFLTTESLSWPERNLYTAHEIAQVKPLWERCEIHKRFIAANAWAGDFLPNAFPKNEEAGESPKAEKPVGRNPIKFLDVLEIIAFRFQLLRMKPKMTTEAVSPNIARFHPHNVCPSVLSEYIKRLDKFT